jgi:mannose-6-phosphate isomerase-like protein (cupin superfamily)
MISPVVVSVPVCTENEDVERFGQAQWCTLFSAERTPTEAFTAGIVEIVPDEQLKLHRHAPPELYYTLAGEGIVLIDGQEYVVRANIALFIPGNTWHSIRNTGQTLLRIFYVFPVDSFDEVEYIFAVND